MYIIKLVVLIVAFMLASFLGSIPVAAQVACDQTDPLADCDGDGVANGVDECPATVVGEDLVVGACTISGLDTILPTGCSLTEAISEDLDECALNASNHGKYVSCVAKVTNALKKQKIITGAQKGKIQSCAAKSDVGK